MSHSDLDNEANGKMNSDQVCPRRIAMELNNLGVAMLQQVNQDEAANDMLRLALKACLESSPSRSSSEGGHNIQPSDAKDVCKIDSTFGNYLAMIQQGRKKLEASVVGACTTCLSRVENRHVRVQNTFLLLDPIRIEYSGNDVDEGLAVAITMHNISVLFCRQGSWDRAMQMIETALDLVASIEECDAYPYVGSLVFPILLNNLGHLMTRTGCDRDKDGAGGMLSEALRVAQDAVLVTRRYCQDGEELPATLCHFISTIFYNNGSLHYMEGEHEEAAECFSEALSYSSPSNPSLLISVLFNMNSIGRCYLKEGKSNHAAKIFHQALAVETRISNTSNSTLPAEVYASIYFNLGYICCRSGLQLEAMQYFSTSLRLTTNTFGSTHAHVVGLQDRIDHFWRSFLQQSDVNSAAQAA